MVDNYGYWGDVLPFGDKDPLVRVHPPATKAASDDHKSVFFGVRKHLNSMGYDVTGETMEPDGTRNWWGFNARKE